MKQIINELSKEVTELKDRGEIGLFAELKLHYIINKLKEAINYTRCCESVKDKYTHTFEVDLNSEKRKEQYNKHIEQIHNAPCKVYLYDGDKYIELKP
jgi:hypothetical protein